MDDKVWHKHYPPGISKDVKIDLSSVGEALDQACDRYANNIAFTCLGADLTYRQFQRLSSDFAAFLEHDLGLKKGDRLAIMLPNILQFPIAFLAAQKLGVICVNTNPLYTPREMQHQFADSGAKAIVILDLFLKNLEEIIGSTKIEHVIATSVGDGLPLWKGALIKGVMKVKGVVPKHQLKTIPFRTALRLGARKTYTPRRMTHDDLALLQYTGGTTGISKGAMLSHRAVLANLLQIRHCSQTELVEGQEVVLTPLPLYHIFALTVNFLAFVTMGQRIILIPRPIPIANVVKPLLKYPVTVMTGVNTLFNSLVNDDKFKANPPRQLKFALAGGMALQAEVNRRWQEIVGQPIIEGFGLTEASPVTHVNPIGHGGRSGSIGIPLASTDAKIVDEAGREVATGEVGELVIKGPQVMAGYWQRPDETAKVIKEGWLWTGDIAKCDVDGFFYIVDRKKDMILVSGFNVYPNEVEEVLVMHPKVLEAAVVGVPDQHSGEAVKAYVVARDKSLNVEELMEHCVKNLTGYKRPKHFEFRPELPKTNVGKILRRELRDGHPTAKGA